jgi:hypothetical protein
MADPIPQPDEDFNNLMNLLVPYVADHAAALGIAPATATAFTAAHQLWNDGFAAQKVAQTAAQAATATKVSTRTGLTALGRPIIQMIQNNSAVTDEARTAMGLPIGDTIPTRPPVPSTRPLIVVDTR